MMKRMILLVVGCMSISAAHAQPGYQLVLRNEIRVTLPAEPDHQILDSKGKESYVSYYEGCSYNIGIIPEAISDYFAYLHASDSERIAIAQQLLEGISNGKLGYRNQHLISMNSFRTTHNYIGLDVEYATLPPENLASRKRYSTLLLVGETVYIFDCWYMDDKKHDAEKEAYFKSIQIKR